MKYSLLLSALFLSLFAQAQVILVEENFDGMTAPMLPNNWITSTLFDIGFRTDPGQPSAGYADVSGVQNIVIRNSDSTGIYTLTSPAFSTVDYTAIEVAWGSRVSNNFLSSGSSVPVFEYSVDGGVSWSIVSYVDNEANSTWSLVNGGAPILLPIEAENQETVHLRWTISIVNQADGTYRMDDFVVRGVFNPTVQISFQVNMGAVEISPGGVFFSASYNGFGLQPMQHIGNAVYIVSITVPQNLDINYRFVNGPAIGNAELVPVGCGQQSAGVYYRSFNSGTIDQSVPIVCFGSCDNCSFYTLTLRVNMSLEGTEPNGVYVEGNFPGLSADVQPMSNVGGSVWQFIASLPADYIFRYRFLNGGINAPESTDAACSSPDGYREIVTSNANTVANVVCFGECTNCVIIEPVFVNVTLKVNMSQQTVSPDGVFVIGSFQDFTPGVAGMIHEGNGIYSYTFTGQQGVEYLYRFCNGLGIENSEYVPENCAFVDENANTFRTVFAGETDQVVNAVCFGACLDCVVEILRNITIRVNMEEEVSVNSVFVVGNFQGFQLGTTAMESVGNDIYEFTVSAPEGSVLQYRFVNGSVWSGIETVPVDCGNDDGTGTLQRTWLVTDDTTLNSVCFGDCEDCDGIGVQEESTPSAIVFPNPGNDYLVLKHYSQGISNVEIKDVTGKLIARVSTQSSMTTISTDQWERGVYFIRYEDAQSRVIRWVKI